MLPVGKVIAKNILLKFSSEQHLKLMYPTGIILPSKLKEHDQLIETTHNYD